MKKIAYLLLQIEISPLDLKYKNGMQICRHPLWSEISVLARAKCQPAQTDGVKSRAEWLTLVASY